MIWLFVAPSAMRLRMYAFICCAIGESDSSSVVWHCGQTSSASSSLCVGCCSLASAGAARASSEHGRYGREPHVSDPQLVFACLSALRMPLFEVGVRRRPDDVRRHDAAVRGR